MYEVFIHVVGEGTKFDVNVFIIKKLPVIPNIGDSITLNDKDIKYLEELGWEDILNFPEWVLPPYDKAILELSAKEKDEFLKTLPEDKFTFEDLKFGKVIDRYFDLSEEGVIDIHIEVGTSEHLYEKKRVEKEL